MDTQSQIIPARETRAEIKVINSRFIATIAPTFSPDEAKSFIERIRSEYSDATHNVPAYVIGHGNATTTHCSDDGEPFGTAGRPALAVLQGSGFGDACVVVTRYFGGAKLGKGGLVRAYGDAVRAVLKRTPRAQKISTHTVMIALPYSLYELVSRSIDMHQGVVLDEDFAADVTMTCRFPSVHYVNFQDALRELSHGKLQPLIIKADETTIMPIG
jgi:uncharacterized YigZ family protein